MEVYIVIPAYNESSSLEKVIEGLLDANYNNIVVIDDGSKDNTAEIAMRYPVHLISHVVNLGQGAALQTGNEYALSQGAQAIVHFDSDGQHRTEDIRLFMDAIENGFDAVRGSRFLGTKQHMPWSKKWLLLKPAIMVNWLFTGLKLTDAHNGFRAFSRKGAEKIKITQNRMAHPTEILAEIGRQHIKYTEVPVEIIYTEYGQNFLGGIKIVLDLLKKKIFN